MTELEIAFVGLFILIGAGAIVYAGTRSATPKKDNAAGDGSATTGTVRDDAGDVDVSADGGGAD
jgi:hypothetical protein